MRRGEPGLIDLTPLLDVVFILLFALILNVNVTRAQDQEASDNREALLTAELTSTNQALKAADDHLANLEEMLVQSGGETDLAEEQLTASQEAYKRQEDLIKAYSQALGDLLNKEVNLMETDLPDGWQVSDAEAQVLVEEWLKYQQIGERYLFVDVWVSDTDGRVYIDETYTGINIEAQSLGVSEVRDALKEELQNYLLDWLDHKAGGYTFVFVSVVSDKEVKRAVIELVFDGLQGLQTAFDKDRYLINRFVTYK